MLQKIPTLDLNDFLSAEASKRNEFVSSLGKAFEEIGFISLKNHGFKRELEKQLYSEVESFFNLSIEIKEQYEIPGLGGQRGYTSFGKEHAKGRIEGDLKEFWHFGQEENSSKSENPYGANVKVKELQSFNKIGNQSFSTLEDIGIEVLKAIALYLNLDEDYFDNKVRGGNSILRPIHYPPITQEPKNAVRAAEHEDINLITLLMSASAEGLEVKSKSGHWIKANNSPGEIIINVGDMLQRLTNNRLISTTHRVTNPPKDKWSKSRYSIPFFLHPKASMALNCLENCISPNEEKSYTDITAGDYLTQRLKEIGLL